MVTQQGQDLQQLLKNSRGNNQQAQAQSALLRVLGVADLVAGLQCKGLTLSGFGPQVQKFGGGRAIVVLIVSRATLHHC